MLGKDISWHGYFKESGKVYAYVIEAGGTVGAIPYKVAIRCFIWHNTPEATIYTVWFLNYQNLRLANCKI